MKITVAVHYGAEDEPADDFVVQNLKDVGFEQETDENGIMSLTFDGEISANDLAYGASMFKSMRKR